MSVRERHRVPEHGSVGDDTVHGLSLLRRGATHEVLHEPALHPLSGTPSALHILLDLR